MAHLKPQKRRLLSSKRILSFLVIYTVVFFAAPLQAQSLKTADAGGQTIVYIDPVFLRDALSFSAAYAYRNTPSQPSDIQISFATGRRGYNFERSRSLTFLIDQRRELRLGMMEYDVQNNMVRLFVPLETFMEIAQASSVSGQVGEAAFQLNDTARRGLAMLVSSWR
jgi:hypothetical protein